MYAQLPGTRGFSLSGGGCVVKISGLDMAMLVFYSAWMLFSIAFLAFGWRLPGTFSKRGARLAAWAGVCFSTSAIIGLVVLGIRNSGLMARFQSWLLVPLGALIVMAFVLWWKSGRAAWPRAGGDASSQSGNGPPHGKHEAH